MSPFIAKKIGNWDAAMDFFQKMGLRVKTVTLKSQEEICKKYKQKLVNHILAQDMNWEALKPKTKEIKNQKNRELVYLDTELYVKSITTSRTGNTYTTGIKKGIAYRRKGSFVSVDRVAILMEFGTTRMAERPLWEPTLMEMGGKKGIRDYVVTKIYETLKRRAGSGPVRITKKDISSRL